MSRITWWKLKKVILFFRVIALCIWALETCNQDISKIIIASSFISKIIIASSFKHGQLTEDE